jgi:cell division protein FtsI (penicillin-binding protein 3)
MSLLKKSQWQNLILSKNELLQPHDKMEINPLRMQAVIAAFAIGFMLLTIRLFDVTFFHHGKNVIGIDSQDVNNLHKRTEIVDRNGVLLAVNLTTASLYANPKIILDPKEAALKLNEIFPELNYRQLIEELHSTKSFTWIKRNLTPKEQYAVNNLGIPGLFFENSEKRVYTHGPLLSHVLGFVGMDGKGLAGIEKYYDDHIANKSITNLSEPIKLSIDVRIQSIVSEELMSSIEEFKAIGAVGIVLDAKSGEVISSVSLPSYDPHYPGHATQDQLFNRFSLGLYEPGSIFKTYTMAMALDSNIISLNDIYNVDSPIKAARFRITDYHGKGGHLSVPEIFMYSSNIGTAKISLDLGKKKQRQFLKNFGLLDELDIEVPEKATPMYPKEKNWSEISTMTISYGHGIAVTPLHIIRAAGAMLNGGILNPITFLKRDHDKIINSVQVIKPETSKLIQKLYRLVVEYGTGKKSNVNGYLVGGKTGTADKTAKGGYNKNSRLSSFISAFPIHDPKYVVLVMIDEPKGNQSTGGYATAGMTAAPASGRIISRIGPLLGMEAIDENDPIIKQQLLIDYHNNLNHDL